jgi:hypothetical protein
MPNQKGNKERQGNNYEKWQTGNPGCVSGMQHQDVQDREELSLSLSYYSFEDWGQD